jgi:hypothetical protein
MELVGAVRQERCDDGCVLVTWNDFIDKGRGFIERHIDEITWDWVGGSAIFGGPTFGTSFLGNIPSWWMESSTRSTTKHKQKVDDPISSLVWLHAR